MPETISEELEPLDIKCTSTDCENGFHCFRQKQKRKKEVLTLQGSWMIGIDGAGSSKNLTGISGRCRACGLDLIDWDRVHKNDLNDVHYTFEALKKELIRHYYWHLVIDQHARNHALRKGSIEMQEFVKKRITTSVGGESNYHEGRQTPMHQSGNIVYYAQHATASCCRVCIEEWHKISRGRALTDTEIEYLTELAMLYITERLPELTPEGQKIPRIRRFDSDK